MLQSLRFQSRGSSSPVVFSATAEPQRIQQKIQPHFGGDYFRTNNFPTQHNLPNANKTMWHTSGFFRDSELYDYLPQYLAEKFPQGVSIEAWGASSGQEPYGLAMLLMQRLGLSAEALVERYPIDASDINPTVIELAVQGMYGFSAADDDLDRMRALGINPADYMNELPLSAHKTREAIFNEGHLSFDSQELKSNLSSVWQIKPELSGVVLFDVADFTKQLVPSAQNAPARFVLLRNALGHYKSAERSVLAQKLFEALPSGSALVIGNWDFRQDIPAALKAAGFKQQGNGASNPKRFIFERP